MAVNILLKRSATASKRPTGASMAFGELNLNYDAATGGLYYKNSDGNVVKVGPCQVSATAPNVSPAGSSGNSAGEFWYDTVNTTLKVYNGTTWVNASAAAVSTNVTGTAPITVNNTDPLNPVVGINAASTSASGAVQLNDSTSSTSTSTAATANAVKSAYDKANAALPKSGGTMTGDITFNAGQTFPGVVTSVSAAGGSAISVDNTDPTQPVLDVDAATTTSPGVVQLNDTTTSTSTTEALTAAQGKSLQDQIDALVISSNLTLAGTFDASTGLVDSVTTAGTAAGFTVGSALPAPASGNADYFVIVDVQGSTGPSGTPPYHIGDWFLSNGSSWQFLNVGFQAPYATTTTEGVVQLATDAEVQAGSNTDHVVTPSGLQSKISDSTNTTSSTTIASSTAVKAAYDAATAAALWTENAGVLSPSTTNNVVSIDVPMGIDGLTVLDSALSIQSLIAPATATFIDNIQSITVNGSDQLITYVLDSLTGNVPGILAVDEAANPAPFNLQIGELQLNGDAGSSGYVLQSNGPGTAPTWVANSVDGVQGVTGTAPITVDNTDPANPVISISAASTSAAGAVQLNDSTTSTSTSQAATANAAKTAYDAATAAQSTANAALPKAGGTMTGNIVFQDAGEGVQFNGGSSIYSISDSVATTSSTIAASSTAVKAAYDAALAAQSGSPMTSATVLYVNVTTGNNTTGARGTAKPFATITAALAAASEGDTIFVAPGTYVESPTLSKGVNLVGTFTDQAISSGPKISGTFTVSISGPATRNWAVSNFQFQASSVGNNSVVVSNNSFGSGGLGSFTNCFFQQFTSASLTEQCFATSGTWTRSLYLRNCTFDGNFTHNAGTTAGASGYIVIDNLLGIAGNDKYYKIASGTCEFRNPSNALAPVLHTGGFAVFSNVLAWISNVAATTTIFGGTGFAYKGTSAGLGQAVAYFTGQGCNVVEGSTWGKISIGTNVVYAFGNVNYDTSLATLSGIPLTVAAPNPNGVLASMARPQWNYLVTPSSVTAANQLGVILDSTNGNVYTTSAFDAGTY